MPVEREVIVLSGTELRQRLAPGDSCGGEGLGLVKESWPH